MCWKSCTQQPSLRHFVNSKKKLKCTGFFSGAGNGFLEEKKRTGAAQNGSETLTQVGWDSEKTEVNENRFVTKGSNVKS